jgi:hypothetical protein
MTISIGWLPARTTSAQSLGHETAAETSIRHTVEGIEDEDTQAALRNDLRELDALWSDDLTVNNPNNRIVGKREVFGFMKKRSSLQYESYERHREATVVKSDVVVTMGYETVTPKAGTENAGKTETRRYTNVWHLESGRWRLIARQATNITVQ